MKTLLTFCAKAVLGLAIVIGILLLVGSAIVQTSDIRHDIENMRK